jgi:SAM-dependent methyltransferase
MMEHIDNPLQVLEEFHRILKPGGKLIIKVPYFAHNCANVPMHKNYWSFRCKILFDNTYYESDIKWSSVVMSHKWGSSWKGYLISAPFEVIINLIGYELYDRFFCYVRPVFEITFEVIK